MNFDKSCVDVAELSDQEIRRVAAELGVDGPWRKLSNGGCAANYVVGSAVVKAVVGADAVDLARDHLAVLRCLDGRGAPKPVSDKTVACVTTSGLPARALAMELVAGEAANVLARTGVEGAIAAVGGALGRLHALRVDPPVSSSVSHPSFLERFLRVSESVEDALQGASHGFVEWLSSSDWARLGRARRALKAQGLPAGLLHGDPYTDNLMLVVEDGVIVSARLVDWEDACVGPLMYDLGCALVASAFDDAGTLREDVFKDVLRGYVETRGLLSGEEAAALPSLMAANALACALYRWYQFHVVDSEVPDDAKNAYLEMQAIVDALDSPHTSARVTTLIQEHGRKTLLSVSH